MFSNNELQAFQARVDDVCGEAALPCPSCGAVWEKDTTGEAHQVVIHKPFCAFVRWLKRID